MNVRLATLADAPAVQRIYAPYVRDSAISFETEAPSAAEMRARMERLLPRYPWLVWDGDGVVEGYAYASPHRDRAAYRWSVDVSVYVDADRRRRGIGRRLYRVLLAACRAAGFCNAYAGIALPNPASVGLHEAMGFTAVGVYRHVGYKLGRWHDVGWWALALQPPAPAPVEPRLLTADEFRALAAGLR